MNIRQKDRDAVIHSLRAGVVPRTGQHLIQVGRASEVASLLQDIERISSGSSTFRVVVGDFGAGKSYFLALVRSIALEKKLVVALADLNPDRRLQASGGQARSLYAELMRNLATRARPEGGALQAVVEKFVASAAEQAAAQPGTSTESVIRKRLAQLCELVGGYDFADVIAAYWRGHQESNDKLMSDAIRWLRGEFSTRTDAREALGVRTIVDDSNVYDQLKLMGRFVRLAGFGGLLIGLDEMVNLYKLANTQARNANYEQLLRMLNDSLQGNAEGLGFILGGTPEFLTDTRRGLYSYPALQSRLAQNTFAAEGRVDFTGPVIRLATLTPEDFYVLLQKIRDVHAFGDVDKRLIPDEGIAAFMAHCNKRIGDAYFRTPRTTITSFINLLAVLEQNPGAAWEALLGEVEVVADKADDTEQEVGEADKANAAPSSAAAKRADEDLVSFQL